MKAVVVAHGEVDESDAALARAADLVIAADGGSAHLARWGVTPHVVIGDLDSLPSAAPAAARVERWPREKDKSDTELAVERAVASDADDVVVLGALGGPRADHAIANVLLLALDRPSFARVRLVRGPLSMRVVRGPASVDLAGAPGDLVTLLAVRGDALGVETGGLRYPLNAETLKLGSSRGISNEIAEAGAKVSLRSGSLLVIEDGRVPPGLPPQPKA